MKVFICIVFCSCLFVISQPDAGLAQGSTEIPKVIREALGKYKEGGAEAFLPALIKGSPLEGDKNALSQSNNLRQIESFYGKFIGYEHVQTTKISDSTSLVFYIMMYEQGPLFSNATIYDADGGQAVVNFNFHTELSKIIPVEVLTR